MADTPGVTNNERSTNNGPAAAVGKNRKVLLLAGGGALLLLLGHKGSSASGNGSGVDPNAQLQAQSDALAQQEADAALSAQAGGPLYPGGVAPTTIGDQSTYTGQGANSPVNVTINEADKAKAKTPQGPVNKKTFNQIWNEGYNWEWTQNQLAKQGIKPTPGGKGHSQPPKHTGGKPPKKSGATTHPSKGAKVQATTGTTVHGRTFPGATGHSVGPPRYNAGAVHQDVTVNYGGHTETHTSVNHGTQWINNTKGKNPPSRNPPHTVHPVGQQPMKAAK